MPATATAPAKSPKRVSVPPMPGEDAPLLRSTDPISPFKTITKKSEKTMPTNQKTADQQPTAKPALAPQATVPTPEPAPAPKPEMDKLAKVIEHTAHGSTNKWAVPYFANLLDARTCAGMGEAEAVADVTRLFGEWLAAELAIRKQPAEQQQ
jgi:hypothetical protein